jgi:hypothetical protein
MTLLESSKIEEIKKEWEEAKIKACEEIRKEMLES